MKRLKYMALAVAAASLSLAGCDSDADTMYIDGLESSTLLTSQNEIVLTSESASLPAITFAWTNESQLKIYGTTVAGIADKSMPVYDLQFSLTQDFASYYSQSVDNGVVSFTVQELNTIVLGLGANPFEKTDVYVRINTALGTNDVDSKPSEAQKLIVTCYKVSYTTARMLSSDKTETLATLYSADSDGDGEPDTRGIYQGFYGAAAWTNFYLRENDGTEWGNVGASGKEFLATTDADKWNFWYPGVSGCYFTEINVSSDADTKAWTATLIPSLAISGDVTGDMQYIRSENRWMCVVTTTADNQTFSISGTGKKYDKDSSTDDDAATDTPVTFGSDGDGKLAFNGGGSFSIEKAGTYTISLILTDYTNLTYTIKSGAEEVEDPAPSELYLMGINDKWDFSYVMSMTDEDNLIYTGAFGSNNCTYGYYFAIEKDNYSDVYGGADGALVAGTESNIAIGTSGVYIWQVDWANKTYTATEVTKVQYAGLNDDWTATDMTQDASSPSKYTATVTITKASEWGAKVILNGNWETFVGGTDGKIEYGKSFTDDQSLEAGTYTLTFDFAAGTYSFKAATAEEDYPDALYAIGIDGSYSDEAWVTLSETETAGVYSGTITVTSTTNLNFEVYEDQTYTTKVGPVDNSGNISTGSSVWKFWVDASGTYTLTISLVDNTWTIQSAE